ncbi:MAG: hypothetical protein GX045_03955 [Clostridiaceae bacterium]|jgi:hypothetical protein|nr:hypothetical protein [Clostridiaceae bacterium]
MDHLFLTGMPLKEAMDVLKKEGILDYEIIMTSAPRLSNRNYSDGSRVIMAKWDDDLSRLKVLVCNP